MRVLLAMLSCSFLLLGCGDGGAVSIDQGQCSIDPLPIQGGTGAPTLMDITLEVQGTDQIVLNVTVEDDDGFSGLAGVIQEAGVFPDDRCEGVPIDIQGQLNCSGCEQNLGTAVESSAEPALFDAISGSTEWPVEVTLEDVDDNLTSGQVEATVTQP